MAMQILDTIPDHASSDDLKSKTKALLVELFVQQAYVIQFDQTKTDFSNKKDKE
jgi:hypothetical protein